MILVGGACGGGCRGGGGGGASAVFTGADAAIGDGSATAGAGTGGGTERTGGAQLQSSHVASAIFRIIATMERLPVVGPSSLAAARPPG